MPNGVIAIDGGAPGAGAPRAGLLDDCKGTWYELDQDPDEAFGRAIDLLSEAERCDDEHSAAYACCTIAWWIGQFDGEIELALHHLARIDQTLRRVDDAALRLRWHTASAIVLGSMGDRAGRFDQLEQMRQVSVEIGDVWHELVALHDMARHFGRDDLLEEALERAEAVSATLSEPPSVLVSLLLHSAQHLAEAGRFDRAEDRSRRALSIAEADRLVQWIAYAQCQLAEVLALAGRGDDALEVLATAERSDSLPVADRLLSSARVRRSAGLERQAIDLYQQLLDLPHSGRVGAQHCVDAARELAPLLARDDQWQRAYETQLLYDDLRGRFQSEEDTRRVRGLEVLHRVTVARQVAEQEQARSRHLADDVARLEQIQRELIDLASRDALTGVFNRRWVDLALGRFVAAAESEAASIAILDADHFKSVNDRYGHAVGDEVLRVLASIVAAELRSADVIARLGGEEFLLLLPATDLDDARITCDRVRAVVESYDWDAIADGLTLTVSIGVAEVGVTTGIDAVLAAADSQLYAAKRAGRNTVRG